MVHARLRSAIVLILLFGLGSCGNNVGRAFDRGGSGGGGGGGGSDPATSIQIPVVGGITRATRPQVELVAPEGSGFPVTTPIVVLFDQAMNLQTLRESTTEEPSHLFVRLSGTQAGSTQPAPLSGTYTLLLGGRLLVFTPAAPFPADQTFEVVVGSGVRDLDQQTISRQGVIATFTVDGTEEASFRVLATVPETRNRAQTREDPIIVALTAPPTPTTVTPESLFLRRADNTRVTAPISFPIEIRQVPDPRIVVLTPESPLEGETSYELIITDDIQSGEVKIDTGSTPLASFTTIGPRRATSAEVGNPSAGFDHRVNLANVANLTVAVEVPSSSMQGDTATVRIYGNDRTQTQDTLIFEERTATIASNGQGTTTVSFANAIGTADAPTFRDGEVTILARLSRGANDVTGWIRGEDTRIDTTPPTITSVGPPSAPGTNVVLTDLNLFALQGLASEQLGSMSLTVGSSTIELFGSDAQGRFMSLPVLLNRATAPVAFTLNVADAAGNPSQASLSGTIVQRGYLNGNVSTGTLNVVAYDEATLLPVSGATVLIEPGMPQKPAVGRVSGQTDSNGLASFTGLTQASYSITILRDGYHIYSLLDTAAGNVSLPLRPTADATASASGMAIFQDAGGIVARVGLNLLADEKVDSFLETSSSSATSIPTQAVRPNRSLMVSAFAGIMPPTQTPTFGSAATLLGAVSGARGRNAPPPEPVAAGNSYNVNLALLPAVNTFVNFGVAKLSAQPSAFNLAAATGLDTANLDGDPQTSVLVSVGGFNGLFYMGPGFVSGTGTSRAVNGSYSLTGLFDFGGLSPAMWASTQARDTSGNITRNRALFTDPVAGTVSALVPVAGIPTVSTPAGNFTGSPLVQVADRLTTTVFSGSLALRKLTAIDSDGREWTVLHRDTTAAGGTVSVQYPDLAGVSATGLKAGTWAISATDYLIGTGVTATELNFEDLPRLQMTYAFARAVNHTVQ